MITIEVAVTASEEARIAVAAGADRLEICSVLEVGGVTPSPATFLQTRESVAVPVWVLIRPRPGDFVYTRLEFETLRRDAAWFLDHGADGIVTGVLNADRTIDFDRSAELVGLAKGRAVFHRAFDDIPDGLSGIEQLIDMGYRRVLTSGGAATALEGADAIAELIRASTGRIEVLPGGGIGPTHALEIIRRTRCTQLHGSFRGGNPNADPEQIREMKLLLSHGPYRG